MKRLKKGDRIRLRTRTFGGWKGKGTVIEDQITDIVLFCRDGEKEGDKCSACREEVALMRDQTPYMPTAKEED